MWNIIAAPYLHHTPYEAQRCQQGVHPGRVHRGHQGVELSRTLRGNHIYNHSRKEFGKQQNVATLKISQSHHSGWMGNIAIK